VVSHKQINNKLSNNLVVISVDTKMMQTSTCIVYLHGKPTENANIVPSKGHWPLARAYMATACAMCYVNVALFRIDSVNTSERMFMKL